MNNKVEYLWGLLSKFIPEAIYLGTTMVLARLLVPEDFGVIGVLSLIFTVANALTDAGLGGSLIKEKNLTKIDCSSIFSFNVVVSLVLYLIIFLSAGAIETYYEVEGLAKVARVISLTFVLNSFALVPKALIAKQVNFKLVCRISIISVIIASLCSIIYALIKPDVYAIVTYRVVLSAVSAILYLVYSKYQCSFKFSVASLKKLLPFGIFTTLSTVVDSIYENALSLIFGKVAGMGSTGYFYQAKKTEEALTISITSTIGQVAFPILTKHNDDYSTLKKESESIFRTILLLFTPMLLLISVYSEEIMVLLYGRGWADSGVYMRLLMYAAVFMVMENLNRTFIKSLGKGQPILYLSLIKRSIGIAMLFAILLINPKYLVPMYVFTAFLGFLINQIAFAKLTHTSFLADVRKTILVLLPNVLVLVLYNLIYFSFDSFLVKCCLSVLVTLFYYLIVLRCLGFKISTLKKLFKR